MTWIRATLTIEKLDDDGELQAVPRTEVVVERLGELAAITELCSVALSTLGPARVPAIEHIARAVATAIRTTGKDQSKEENRQ